MKIKADKKPLNVILIGLGRVGASDDFTRPNVSRTHLSAILRNKHLKLIGIVDSNSNQLQKAKSYFPEICNVKSFESIKEINDFEVDIIVCAGPTSIRYDQIKLCVNLKPRFILIEKPVAYSLQDCIKIQTLLNLNNIESGVNYQRRLSPIFLELFTNNLADIRSVFFKYSGGFINNGTHFFDLVSYYFGKINKEDVSGKVIQKIENDDLYLDLSIKSKHNFQINFISLRNSLYHIFECEIYYNNYRVSLFDNCTRKIKVNARLDSVFPGYIHLDHSEIDEEIIIDTGFNNIYVNIVEFLNFKKKLSVCTIEEASEYINFSEYFKNIKC